MLGGKRIASVKRDEINGKEGAEVDEMGLTRSALVWGDADHHRQQCVLHRVS